MVKLVKKFISNMIVKNNMSYSIKL